MTYNFFAFKTLSTKLLRPPMGQWCNYGDTAIVRNFESVQCVVAENEDAFDLKGMEDVLKEKLQVKVIVFEEAKSPVDFKQLMRTRIIYNAWYHRGNVWTLYNFFAASSIEEVDLDIDYKESMVVTYRWVLFFWIPIFEYHGIEDRLVRPPKGIETGGPKGI